MRDEPLNPYRAPVVHENVSEGSETPISMLRYVANVGCGSLVIGVGLAWIVALGVAALEGDRVPPWWILCLALGVGGALPSIAWASRRRPTILRARERAAHR